MIKPRDINRKELSTRQPNLITDRHNFKIILKDWGTYNLTTWSNIIDDKYSSYSKCLKEKLNTQSKIEKLQSIKIIVLPPGHFKCNDHNGRCNGYYDPSLQAIFVSINGLHRNGIAPLLKHEWGHADGIVPPDHSNSDYWKKCTKY